MVHIFTEVKFTIDKTNKRVIVECPKTTNVAKITEKIAATCTQHNLTKSFVKVSEKHWQQWLLYGYTVEGFFTGYFNGETAISMAKFFDIERASIKDVAAENKIITDIINSVLKETEATSKQGEHNFRMAVDEDIPQLAELYAEVFASYPTPITDQQYIKKCMQNNTVFIVAEQQQQIISAASADINDDYKCVELTDCATKQQHRGQGLMSTLINKLETEMQTQNMKCLYTIARAQSFGMNAVFYKHNYHYGGRLIKNCDIFGQFEDMNIWSKVL